MRAHALTTLQKRITQDSKFHSAAIQPKGPRARASGNNENFQISRSIIRQPAYMPPPFGGFYNHRYFIRLRTMALPSPSFDDAARYEEGRTWRN